MFGITKLPLKYHCHCELLYTTTHPRIYFFDLGKPIQSLLLFRGLHMSTTKHLFLGLAGAHHPLHDVRQALWRLQLLRC